jgi:hypothetical protein
MIICVYWRLSAVSRHNACGAEGVLRRAVAIPGLFSASHLGRVRLDVNGDIDRAHNLLIEGFFDAFGDFLFGIGRGTSGVRNQSSLQT